MSDIHHSYRSFSFGLSFTPPHMPIYLIPNKISYSASWSVSSSKAVTYRHSYLDWKMELIRGSATYFTCSRKDMSSNNALHFIYHFQVLLLQSTHKEVSNLHQTYWKFKSIWYICMSLVSIKSQRSGHIFQGQNIKNCMQLNITRTLSLLSNKHFSWKFKGGISNWATAAFKESRRFGKTKVIIKRWWDETYISVSFQL